jgi:hypothetical protein
MTTSRKRIAFSLLFAGLTMPSVGTRLVRADEGQGHVRRPPPAAFDACKDKKSGDACEVTFREHTLTGKCDTTPEDQLACRPDHPPGPPPGGAAPGGEPTP